MFILFLLLLLLPAVAIGVGNETINILPDSNKASFRVDSQNFWKNETPDILGKYLKHGFISSGGSHITSASCTTQPFSFEVFTEQGNRVTADGNGGAVSINYATAGIPACTSGTSVVRVAACAVSGSTTGTNWFRYGTTNIFMNAVNPFPAVPPDCVGLMDVTISSGTITSVLPAPSSTKAFPFDQGVSIEETGGVCDGTTDNSRALQNALDIATAKGTTHGKVILTTKGCTSGAGYKFNTPLTLYPELELDGNNATLTFGGSGAALAITGGTRNGKLRLHDFTLRSTSSGSTIGIYVADIYDVIIDRVGVDGRAVGSGTVVGNSFGGIYINSTTSQTAAADVWIVNSWIKGNKGTGIIIGGNNPTGVFVSNNSIENNGSMGVDAFVVGGHVSVRDNVIRFNGPTASDVRAVGFESFALIGNVIVTDVVTNYMVDIAGTNAFHSTVRVDGNTFYGGASQAVVLINGNAGPIRGNSVSNNYINAAVTTGISVVGAVTNINIVGNYCVNAQVCVSASEGPGMTVLKGGGETLVRKIGQGTFSITLANSGVMTQMYFTVLNSGTLVGSGQIKIRSNWVYANNNTGNLASSITFVMGIGGNTGATCVFPAVPSGGNYRSIYWDIDIAAQNSDIFMRVSSRCGITDGASDATQVSGGGSVISAERMHTSLIQIPSQTVQANTVVNFLAQHQQVSPNTILALQNIIVEGVGQ
jgi:hypothetical protein